MSATTRGLNEHFASIVGTAVTFVVLSTATVVLRTAAKFVTRSPFGLEDYAVWLAWAMFIVVEGLLIKSVSVGRKVKAINDPDDQYSTLLLFTYSAFYFTIIALCIASIALLYRRVFIKRYIAILVNTMLGINFCWWLSSTICNIVFSGLGKSTFPGNPTQPQLPVNYLDWWFTAGIIEQVLLFTMILIPLGEIHKLSMSMNKKIGLGIVFSTSYLCVATGIARLITIYHPHDPSFDVSIGDVWINSHLGTAIMSANLPLCWPVVSHRKELVFAIRSIGMSKEERLKSRSSSQETSNKGDRSDSSDVELNRAVECVTMGPVTKDHRVRDNSVAQSVGAIDSDPDASVTELDSEKGQVRYHKPRKQEQSQQMREVNMDLGEIQAPSPLEIQFEEIERTVSLRMASGEYTR